MPAIIPIILMISAMTADTAAVEPKNKPCLLAEACLCRLVLALPVPDDLKVYVTRRYIDTVNNTRQYRCAVWVLRKEAIKTKHHVFAGRLSTTKPWFVGTDGTRAIIVQYDPIEQMELLGGGR